MNKWFSKITPCVLTALFAIVIITWGYFAMEKTDGWSFVAVMVFVPILIAAIVVDVIVKLLFKRKPFHIWGIEILAIAIGYFIMTKYYVI